MKAKVKLTLTVYVVGKSHKFVYRDMTLEQAIGKFYFEEYPKHLDGNDWNVMKMDVMKEIDLTYRYGATKHYEQTLPMLFHEYACRELYVKGRWGEWKDGKWYPKTLNGSTFAAFVHDLCEWRKEEDAKELKKAA